MTSSGRQAQTQLYFIRHGDATYDVDDAAPALTPLGVVQAKRLRDLHADDPADRINWHALALTKPEAQRQPERNVAMESA
ncbi:MAG TPA: hypothetical protein VFG86_08150 [Chloroflexota bacterium]|nr:hypothetical protein [Chloroflexota bacterium]